MLIWLTLAIALASLGASGAAVAIALRRPTPVLAPVETKSLPEPTPSPLEGLSVSLEIRQDHSHPVFANLLGELLQRREAEARIADDDSADLVISGTVTCNGYAEVYYRAELAAKSSSGVLLTVIENPPSGDRQVNLASSFVALLESEITKRVSRSERGRALRELQGP